MPQDADPRVAEIEELLMRARTRPHAFAMSKDKDNGIVLKADPRLKCERLVLMCKKDGGQPAFMVQGTLTVSGKLFQFAVEQPEVPKSLPRALRQHFKDLKILCKSAFILPGGAVLEDGESAGDEADPADAQSPQDPAGVSAESAPPTGAPDGPAALAARLRGLALRVKQAQGAGTAVDARVVAALKAAGSLLSAGPGEKVAALLDAAERLLNAPATAPAAAGAPAGDVRPAESEAGKRLQAEFDAMGERLKRLVAGADREIGSKATTIAKAFSDSLETSTEKAAKALGLLTSFVDQELARLDAIRAKAAETARTVRDSLRPPADRNELTVLQALGLDWAEADKLLAAKDEDDEAVEAVLIPHLDRAGVPEDRRDSMLAAARGNPKAFLKALDVLGDMDKRGAVDVSPDAMQEARETLEKARQARELSEKRLADARKAQGDALRACGVASDRVTALRGARDQAVAALKALQDGLGDLSAIPEDRRLALAAEGTRLMRARDEALRDLAQAEEDEKGASMAYATASDATKAAEERREKEQGPLDAALEAARRANEKRIGKKTLLDALAFGPLSPANAKLPDDAKAAAVAAYAQDPVLADSGLALAMKAPDPAAVARNLEMVAGKVRDGFADGNGKALDLPIEKRRSMAENALRMGGMLGEGYFKEFDAYLKTGGQHEPDPFGSLDPPLADAKQEESRRKEIAVKRTAAMGEAAVGADGTVDFGSAAAKAAYGRVMFHPGALTVATPVLNARIAETRTLFEAPETGAKAAEVMARTGLPDASAPGRVGAADLVARTLGKAPDALGDSDAKAAVLSAMMTPLAQGPVGSCFATAPARAIRETDPLRAMEEYSKLARTGMFTASDGMQYPANRRAPQGENPLMRSFEYSVATAVQEQANSAKRKQLGEALFGSAGHPKGLSRIRDIKELKGKWASGPPDPTTGVVPEGIRRKLRAAIARDLKFEYNAGLDATGAGGGDGSSTNGVYQILYKGKAIESQKDFETAMGQIGLAAAGETADSKAGKAILQLVSSPAFIKEVKDGYGAPPATPNPAAEADRSAPWKLGGGGLDRDTIKVLNGGKPRYHDIVAAGPASSPSGPERVGKLLQGVLAAHKTMNGAMGPMGTTGENANHAFNTMPGDPSLAKLNGGSATATIESELVKPGRKIATTAMPKEQAARLYLDQLEAESEGLAPGERDLLLAAMKQAPTKAMTPAEVAAEVKKQMKGVRDLVAQRRLDEWFEKKNRSLAAEGKPVMPAQDKDGYLAWFKGQFEKGLEARTAAGLRSRIETPEAVIADTNWGDAASRILFVVRPDPISGDLTLFQKNEADGKLTPAGDNWANAKWDTVR